MSDVTLGFPHLHLRTKRLTYILLCVCNLHTFVVALLLTSCLPARALSRNRRASARGALFTLVSLLWVAYFVQCPEVSGLVRAEFSNLNAAFYGKLTFSRK